MSLVLVAGLGGVGRAVLAELRAAGVAVRGLVPQADAWFDAGGAELVVGDPTRPEQVAAALDGVDAVCFAMPVSRDHLLAATVVASVARDRGGLCALVDLSQMTVSQMTTTSAGESDQHRLHFLAEAVFNWSGLPAVHLRPTVFLDNPLFTTLAAASIRREGALVLPFGRGRTSPVAVADVARVAATILRDPAPYTGFVFELTGPRTVDMPTMAAEYSRALAREIVYVDVDPAVWEAQVLARSGLPPHVQNHVAATARLHRENRYDRLTSDVELITGHPPETIESFVHTRRDLYAPIS
ncbi:NAD(P)H-binding protein [Dactylosporangium sp. NPDC051541]|uniref:NAD(P)H-binding protein n=1 Tax=Dactylosporangium sp. NPDC051541 TaxID=3363977 RepID=UPI0037B1C4FD